MPNYNDSDKSYAELRGEGNRSRWKGYPLCPKPAGPGDATIYSGEERDPAELQVPLQLSFAGIRAISSEMASVPCVDLGVDGLLQELNNVLRTRYTREEPALSTQLQEYIDRNYDFGTAYAYLRPRWSGGNFNQLRDQLVACEARDAERRRAALDYEKERIVKPLTPPRRVWDLYANRVVPYWVVKYEPWAVSHSWMSPDCREEVLTPINAYEWPVPVPSDTTLERVRMELLNYQAEYVWLDVLCLRQVGHESKEALRLEEWQLDVPTIGNVYNQNGMIFHYFSGLGRPFQIGNLDSDRHWLNRAWTLQEIGADSTTAGLNDSSPIWPPTDEEEPCIANTINRFSELLGSINNISRGVHNMFPLLNEMRRRQAVSELDKISGLAYLLRSPVLPAYVHGQRDEDAWRNLIMTMKDRYRGDLLFLYPSPGLGKHAWYPSWRQIRTAPLPQAGGTDLREDVTYDERLFYYRGWYMDECVVEGLAETQLNARGRRRGKIFKLGKNGTRHNFTVEASHIQPIPDGRYTFIGSQERDHWVVAQDPDFRRVKKISVVQMRNEEERFQVQELKLATWSAVCLL